MNKLGMISATSLLAMAMSCSDSKTDSHLVSSGGSKTPMKTGGIVGSGGSVQNGGATMLGGSTASMGGTLSSGGSTAPIGGTGGSMASECNYPDCMSSVGKDCVPSGACTIQTMGLSGSNICYANGLKQTTTTTLDLATASVKSTIIVKNGNTLCFSMDMDPSTANSAFTYTIKNPSGAAIATMKVDLTGAMTVTCHGGQPVLLNSACSGSGSTSTSTGGTTGLGSACTPGTCLP